MDRLLSGLKPHRPELKPPDCIARYVVVKHSWRGKYKRIVCITPSALYTQNPEGRLVVTNSYAFAAVRAVGGGAAAGGGQGTRRGGARRKWAERA
jgi:hypothetical protein